MAPAPASPLDLEALSRMANAVRALSMDAVEAAKSGHPGMPMGMADAATVLFARHLRFDPKRPDWPDRDRFILSCGHGSMLQYAVTHLLGYEAMTLEEIRNFRQLGARTAGHPERDLAIGVETTTGPLGQGFANGVGMALAERLLNARFGDALVDHYTYVIASDGDLMEGINHEAASLAGHLQLDRLIVLFDDNGISIDGATSLSISEDVQARYRAYGWVVDAVDGHDMTAVDEALTRARLSDRPTLICCRTVIGYGAPTKAGKSSSHGAPLGTDELAAAKAALSWPHGPFEVPDDIRALWTAAGARNKHRVEAWDQRLADADEELRTLFEDAQAGKVPVDALEALTEMAETAVQEAPKEATRAASGKALAACQPLTPWLIGGSADLSGSNLTRVKGTEAVSAGEFGGSYIHWGVREHGMAAAMNGIALHGGLIPFSGTFLSFADYCRPSIRLAALMRQRVIHVMTHDSIGLGEDGPTHQPVEHLASLRAIPNVTVIRPMDTVETAEAWQVALTNQTGPTILALSRQGLPTLRNRAATPPLVARGGYALADDLGTMRVVIIASGSEVEIAADCQTALQGEGISVRVVSMPSLDLFLTQEADYQAKTLGPPTCLRVVIEAGVRNGWGAVLRPDDLFFGVPTFGESAPYQALYRHFGLTAEQIVPHIRAALDD